MVFVTPTKALDEVTESMTIFQGGWDPHETHDGESSIVQTGFLSAIYPARDIDEFEARLGSIDLVLPELS